MRPDLGFLQERRYNKTKILYCMQILVKQTRSLHSSYHINDAHAQYCLHSNNKHTTVRQVIFDFVDHQKLLIFADTSFCYCLLFDCHFIFFPEFCCHDNFRRNDRRLGRGLVSRSQTAFFRFSLWCHHKEKRKKAVWLRETSRGRA